MPTTSATDLNGLEFLPNLEGLAALPPDQPPDDDGRSCRWPRPAVIDDGDRQTMTEDHADGDRWPRPAVRFIVWIIADGDHIGSTSGRWNGLEFLPNLEGLATLPNHADGIGDRWNGLEFLP